MQIYLPFRVYIGIKIQCLNAKTKEHFNLGLIRWFLLLGLASNSVQQTLQV